MGINVFKKYTTETNICSLSGGVYEKTFQKWVWLFITAISDIEVDILSIKVRYLYVIYIIDTNIIHLCFVCYMLLY